MNLLKLLHSKRPLKQFVSFFCFISLFIPGCSQVYWLTNDNAKEAKLYLMENITILRNDSSFFPLADTLVETSQIFLIGEEHGISSSREIEFNILKTLNNKTGIQHLLLEASHSFAIQINRYLTTGKTEYIDTLFESLRGTYAWTTEYSTFWKNLYAYNLTLAPENRTSCIGIDVEHQSASAIKFLAKLNPNTPPFDEIKTTILTLQNARFEKISYNAGWNLAVEIHKNLLEFESLYKEFYGENYYDFSTVLKNILSAKAVHEARKKAGPKKYAQMRDSIMCDNLPPPVSEIESVFLH